MPIETCAVTYADMFKRAALLFDRVLVPWFELSYPDDLLPPSQYVEVPDEVSFVLLEEGLNYLNKLNHEYLEKIDYSKLIEMYGDKAWKKEFAYEHVKTHLRNIAIAANKQGVNAIPFYSSTQQFMLEYQKGESVAYQAILSNIPLVSDSSLHWKQVLDFRNDKEAHWKYRALRAWLADSFSTKSVSEASDMIAKKIDDYEWALKKHGITTINGIIKNIISSESLFAIAAGGIAGSIAGPIGTALIAGAITIAKVSVSLSEQLINLEDVKRGQGSEVAVVYEIRKRFKNKEK